MKATARRWLYLVHRWLGIALAVPMAAWFLSGIVMLYVGYPKLTNEEKWAGLPPLAALAGAGAAAAVPDGGTPQAPCCVPLAQALQAAGSTAADSGAWRLTSVAGAPRYVFSAGPKRAVAVDAASGRRIESVAAEAAVAAARHFAGGVPAAYLRRVGEDAWTHSRALDAHRPLHVVAVADAQQRWLYVSSRTGEVVRDATRVERTWGWLGAWLHWLYLFRGGAVDAWWHDIVVWTSLAGSVAVLAGLVVGLWRWRFRGTYKGGRRTPYAGFMARWHHVLGLAGGVLALTWVASGLFSMNPWKMFDAPGPKPDRAAYAGGAMDPSDAPQAAALLAQLRAQGLGAREIEWRRVGGQSLAVALGPGEPRVAFAARGRLEPALPEAHWRAAAARLLPGARVVAEEKLTTHDRYYYARAAHTMTGQRERPLPAWRLRFDDAAATWVTIDPRTGEILAISDSRRRADRWLFAFLHS
ncbi:MAG: PepSY domain-containing protein, partial [Rubrivivax sp.]